MATEFPANVPREALATYLLALADDEIVLGHRDSEWTGHSPIIEEDIAFSNIAQDELGHALAWYSLLERLTGRSPDQMVFERPWREFTCCRMVTYPKGDFAYTVIRQFFFDVAEELRMGLLRGSSYSPLKEIAEKIAAEEAYHLLHSQGLVERLGNATEESRSRMQAATDLAFPQALGMFEKLEGEEELVGSGVVPGNEELQTRWLERIVPLLEQASLRVPVERKNGTYRLRVRAENGGRSGNHAEHLEQLVKDLQLVYQIAPSGRW